MESDIQNGNTALPFACDLQPHNPPQWQRRRNSELPKVPELELYIRVQFIVWPRINIFKKLLPPQNKIMTKKIKNINKKMYNRFNKLV